MSASTADATCAALVLASGSPIGVNGLYRYFAKADIDMFVHVDAKVDDHLFCKAGPRLHYVADRVNVYWRGFSMVEAMVKLLITALNENNYQKFLFLSDDSVPLKSTAQLFEALRPDHDIMTISDVNNPNFRWRYDNFYMLDSKATQIRWRPVKEKVIDGEFMRRIEALGPLLEKGKRPVEEYCRGSQWMCLTNKSVRLILESWNNDEWLKQSFMFSEVPDEAYFQTILGCKAERVDQRYMYTDWSVPTPPRVFRETLELAEAFASGSLFARKIDFSAEEHAEWIAGLL